METISERQAIGLFHDASKKWETSNQCLYPKCKKKPIGSHVIPRSILKLLAENGEVLGWKPSYHELVQNAQNNQEIVRLYEEPRSFGIEEDSFPIKLPLYCSYHDSILFAPLEQTEFTEHPKQVALLAYRALSYNTCYPHLVNNTLAWAKQHEFSHAFSSPEEAAILQNSFATSALLEARDQLASMLATEDYAQIEWELFMLNIPACIASTAAYIPIIENQDTDILNGTLSFTAQDVLTFSLFPDNTQMKSYCVLSRFKGSQRADYSRVAFRQLSRSDLQDVLFATAFRQGNVCIAPAWWNSLKREDKQQLKEIHLDF